MLGPSSWGEFMRIDLTPSTAQPSSQRLGHRDAGLALLVLFGRPVGGQVRRRVVGDVLDPGAGLDQHARERVQPLAPAGLIGSKPPGRPSTPGKNIASLATSPNSPENRSIRVTPGNISLGNVGKSSMVISPYLAFICCGLGRAARALVAAAATASGCRALGFSAIARPQAQLRPRRRPPACRAT